MERLKKREIEREGGGGGRVTDANMRFGNWYCSVVTVRNNDSVAFNGCIRPHRATIAMVHYFIDPQNP